MSFETAIQQWREGERRVEALGAEEQRVVDRVVARLVAELRRRLGGGAFTVDELVELYEQGTGWTLDIAVAAAPETPAAWEQHTVADAAFGRYVREATDFAGGKRLSAD